jgi:hypothetical protein
MPAQRDRNSQTRARQSPGERAVPPRSSPRANAAGRLLGLVEETPKFSSAQVRRLWPQIKAALREGHKLKRIWECLNDDGVRLSYAKLRWHVATLKRMEAEGLEVQGGGTESADARSAASTATATANSEPPKRDPLKNLRERMNKRPGFEFNENPPDKKKLI